MNSGRCTARFKTGSVDVRCELDAPHPRCCHVSTCPACQHPIAWDKNGSRALAASTTGDTDG